MTNNQTRYTTIAQIDAVIKISLFRKIIMKHQFNVCFTIKKNTLGKKLKLVQILKNNMKPDITTSADPLSTLYIDWPIAKL